MKEFKLKSFHISSKIITNFYILPNTPWFWLIWRRFGDKIKSHDVGGSGSGQSAETQCVYACTRRRLKKIIKKNTYSPNLETSYIRRQRLEIPTSCPNFPNSCMHPQPSYKIDPVSYRLLKIIRHIIDIASSRNEVNQANLGWLIVEREIERDADRQTYSFKKQGFIYKDM